MTRQKLFEVTQELSGHGIGIEAGYRGPARFRNSPVPRGAKECVEVGPRGKPSPRDSIAVGDAVSQTFASWNLIGQFLREIDALRRAG
jgi:hypothetical protein